MNGSWREWPALDQPGGWPGPLPYQQAVWGKFRGSREDFGWIGRSARFDEGGFTIEQRLSLGSEDQLDRAASFWRVVGDEGFAIRIYPSPAVDRAGRRGLEKHFIECACAALPRAAAAAAMLHAAGTQPDASQVSAAQEPDREGRVVALRDGTLDVAARLPSLLEAGIADLERLQMGPALVDAYDAILDGTRPAPLRAPEPLRPEALAAFLLPLDRAIADRVSVAGWIVSSRFDADALKAAWDVVVHDGVLPGFARQAHGAARRQAERMAAALLNRDPAALRADRPMARPATTTSSPRSTPASLQPLIDFACSSDRTRELRAAGRLTADADGRAALQSALDAIRAQLTQPPRLSGFLLDARRRHLQAKADLIKAAALEMDASLTDLDWTIG